MQHGIYIAEFEKVLFANAYAISFQSLADLMREVNFSKLAAFDEEARFSFYRALVDSIPKYGRGVENDLQILGEDDASLIIASMKEKSVQRSLKGRVRDIWCLLFIGGCP